MKVKRVKRTKKILQYYSLTCKIYAPYKILIDADFIHACKLGKIMLNEQLPTLLNADVKVCISPCILHHLETLQASIATTGVDYGGALYIAKQMTFLKCRHGKGRVSQLECIQAMIGTTNPDHLMIGGQDMDIRAWVRQRSNVPLLYINGSVPVIESPSLQQRQQNESKATSILNKPTKTEKLTLNELKMAEVKSSKPIHRRKKIKGPNPLSVKKKKTITNVSTNNNNKKPAANLETSNNNNNTNKKRKINENSSISTSGNAVTSTEAFTSASLSDNCKRKREE
jgi:U3 small nucleolar RNA-associated protein 23